MNEGYDIKIRLQPKQQRLYELMSTQATVLGYGGSRGGAKSGGARRVLLRRRFDYPGTIGMVFRRTYPELLDNHIEAMWRDFPALQPLYNKGEKTIHLQNGSKIVFRYGENKDDVKAFLGKEYMDIYVDQAEALTEEELSYLRSTARWPGVDSSACKFILGFNPGGPGAAYLKRVFIDKAYKEDEDPADYAFIQAYGWDNIEWVRPYLEKTKVSERDYYKVWSNAERKVCFLLHSAYGRLMNAMPLSLKLGWLEGDFTRFAGQYFDAFDPVKHVRRVEDLSIEPYHERWIGIDWGFAHNTAVYWAAKTAEHVAVYRELVANRMSETDLADKIIELSRGENITRAFISPDASQQRTAAKSIAEQLGRRLVDKGLPWPHPADNGRVAGWRLIYNMLRGTDGKPELLIADTCPRLVSCLPAMVRDPEKVEDCEKFDCNDQGEGGDDAADALRYLLKSYFNDAAPPQEEQLAEALKKAAIGTTSLEELNTRKHIMALRFNAAWKNRNAPLGRPVRMC